MPYLIQDLATQVFHLAETRCQATQKFRSCSNPVLRLEHASMYRDHKTGGTDVKSCRRLVIGPLWRLSITEKVIQESLYLFQHWG